MYRQVMKELKTALKLFLFLTLLTGFIYPLVITGFAQMFFPNQANGSLLREGDKILGSVLIGQNFTDPKYFFGRPSATSPFPYNGESSSGSNMGPSNPAFISLVKERVLAFRKLDGDKKSLVPGGLVTASASGLDPEISPLAALYQASRIAKLRGLAEKDVRDLINSQIIPRSLGILGEPRVNVLQLNLALDQLGKK